MPQRMRAPRRSRLREWMRIMERDAPRYQGRFSPRVLPPATLLACVLGLLTVAWFASSWPGVVAAAAGALTVGAFLLLERRRSAWLQQLDGQRQHALEKASTENERLYRALEQARRDTDVATRRWESLVVPGPEIYSRHDPYGRTTWVSPSCEPVLGYTPTELIGDDVFRLVDSRFRARIRRRQQDRFSARRPFTSAYPVRHRSGTLLWLESTHRWDPDVSDEVLVVSRDISGRRNATRRLRRNERLYRDIFETAATGMALFDPHDNGRCLQANRALSEILGYSGEELREVHFRDLTHPLDQELTPTVVREMLQGERNRFQVEKRYLRKDGGLLWALVTGSLIRGDRGEPRYITTQIQDISDRRRAEQSLARMSRQQDLILNATAEGILRLDRDGRVAFSNRSAAALLGYEPSAFDGMDIRRLMPPDTDPDGWAVLRSLRENISLQAKDECFRRSDDVLLPVDYTCAPVIEGGATEGVVVIFADVSELQRLSTQQRIILDAAAEGIYELDTCGRLRYCNRATEELLGYTAQELHGRDLHDLIHHGRTSDGTCLQRECPTERTLRTGRVHSASGELFYRKDGSRFPAEYICAPILQGDEVQGAVVVFSDISERAASQERLRSAAERLRESQQDLLEMAGLAARGLELPLQTLEHRGEVDSEQLRALQRALSSIAYAPEEARPRPLPLREPLAAAVAATGCPLAGLDCVSGEIIADAGHMDTMFRHLLEIMRRSRLDTHGWKVEERCDESDLLLLFAPQGDTRLDSREAVTGLVLTLCRRLLAANDATLSVEEAGTIRIAFNRHRPARNPDGPQRR